VGALPDEKPSAGLRVGLGVRPPRVAIGVPSVKGISWPRLFEVAIAAQTRTWGGLGNLVFPLTDQSLDGELFWALADRFDADAWATYSVGVGDMETLDPKWFRERLARVRGQLESFEEPVPEEEIHRYLWEHRQGEAVQAVQPRESNRREVLARLAPFHHGDEDFEFDVISSDVPRWPLVDVASLAGLPEISRSPSTSLGPVLRLLLTTEFGRVLPSFEAALEGRRRWVNQQPFTRAQDVARALFALGGSDEHPLPWPWELTEQGLAAYRRGPFRRGAVVLVVGDSAWDFTLFYALRRWTSRAYWLPSWLRRNATVLHYLLSAVHSLAGRSSGAIVVVTTSEKTAFRDEAAQLLRDHAFRRTEVTTANWSEVLPNEPNRLYERGNFGVPRQLVPLEGRTSTDLPTPIPRRIASDDPSDLRWLTEITVDGWAPLRHPAVSGAVLDAHGPEFQRTTRGGAAYYCPATLFVAGEELETITVRPHLSRLSLLDQLRAILEPQGWRCDYSDKGNYAAETAVLFGGQSRLASDLKDPAVRALLNAYVFGDIGIEVAGGRRCLANRHIVELLGDGAMALVETLVGQGVLTRGVVLRCLRCRQTGWYSLDDVGEDFRCRRCRLEQGVERRWIGDEEPAWFYELAEVVHQFIEHNGDVPVLAADRHFAQSSRDVEKAVELEFFPPGYDERPPDKRGTTEIDIVASDGHRLWLGEASVELRLSNKKLKALRRIATAANAHGVLLATCETTFPTNLAEAAQQVLPRRGVPKITLMADIRSFA
jgi:hypothetical protein